MIFEKGIMKKLEKKGGNKTVVLMATNNAFEYKPFEKFFFLNVHQMMHQHLLNSDKILMA